MGSGCSREGYDLFNKHCHYVIKRDWKYWIKDRKHYFWGDTFGRFLRPFCSHKNKRLYNDDGVDEYFCFRCKQWIKE